MQPDKSITRDAWRVSPVVGQFVMGLMLLPIAPAYAQPVTRSLPLPIVVRPATVPDQSNQPDEPNQFATQPHSMESVEAIGNVGVIEGSGSSALVSYAVELDPQPGALPSDAEGLPHSLRIGGHRESVASASAAVDHYRAGSTTGVTKVVGSLAVVLGVLFGFVALSRRFGSTGRSQGLPKEVVQVLGQFSLGGRQRTCVVRFGSKLLALSVTPTGIETLGELDDHQEVEALTQLCLSRDMAVVPERLRAAVDRYAAAQRPRV